MTTRKSRPSTKTLQRKVSRLEREIDTKYYVTYYNAGMTLDGPIDTAPLCLVDMSVGDTSATRTGNQIRVKSIKVRGTVTLVGASILPYSFKVYVVQSRNWNSSSSPGPAFGGTFGVYSNGGANLNAAANQPNFVNKSVYRILKEIQFDINPVSMRDYENITGNTTELVPMTHHFEFEIKKLDILVQYVDSIAGPSSIITNNISFNCVCQDDLQPTRPLCSVQCETEFTDA